MHCLGDFPALCYLTFLVSDRGAGADIDGRLRMVTLFDGYWREANKDSIPRQSGIYCVYTCAYNATEHTVSIKKMLYIGESTNVHDRIATHDRLDDWKKKLTANETLCYSFAPISGDDRIRAEAASV